MKKEDLETIMNMDSDVPTVSVSDLTNKEDRTLLWGYTCCRSSHHVYLKGGEIHVLSWDGGWTPEIGVYDTTCSSYKLIRHVTGKTLRVFDSGIVPDKRLYPEACDAEFCKLLKKRGVCLPFTTWDENRKDRQFHGLVLQKS